MRPAQPVRPLATIRPTKPSYPCKTVRVQRAVIAQPVRAYGIVAASASNLTTVNLPYLARIVQMRVQAGQSVTRGTPLFVVQADPAAALAATQAKSAVTLAQGELARTQSLYDKGLATQSQLATARKAAEDAQQALAAQNQTGVASGNKVIAAPIDGVVLQISAAQGDQVQPGAAILQLAGSGNGNGKDARANVMLGVEPSDVARYPCRRHRHAARPVHHAREGRGGWPCGAGRGIGRSAKPTRQCRRERPARTERVHSRHAC